MRIALLVSMKKLSLLLLLIITLISCQKKDDAPVKKYNRVFFFGDSHTVLGYGKYTAELMGAEYDQCARGGTQTFQYLKADSIDKMVAFNPDIVIVRLGTNDYIAQMIDYEKYGQLISMIKAKVSCPVVVVSVCKMDRFPNKQQIIDFNNYIKTQGTYIDLYNKANYFVMKTKGDDWGIHFFDSGYHQQALYTSLDISILN